MAIHLKPFANKSAFLFGSRPCVVSGLSPVSEVWEGGNSACTVLCCCGYPSDDSFHVGLMEEMARVGEEYVGGDMHEIRISPMLSPDAHGVQKRGWNHCSGSFSCGPGLFGFLSDDRDGVTSALQSSEWLFPPNRAKHPPPRRLAPH